MQCIQADPPDNLAHCNHLDHPNHLSGTQGCKKKVVPTRQDICKNVIWNSNLKKIMDIIIYNNHLLANNAWSLLESLFHVLNAMKDVDIQVI